MAVGRETWLRRIDRIGDGVPPAWRWLPRFGHRLFGLAAGYGHRPLRLLMWTLGVWLACASVYLFGAMQGASAPANPLLSSLERLLPLLDLPQGHALTAAAVPSAWDSLLQGVGVFEALLGWAASLVLFATLAGWADRDRRG